jgi:hypothetical protein
MRDERTGEGMDGQSFDAVVQRVAVAASRRGVLRAGLGALAVTLGFAEAEAADVTCLPVGKRCKSKSQCCSSRCKQGRCRAHHVGRCTAAKDYCVTGNFGCGGGKCFCYPTTGGANFCSAGGGVCMACTRDAECSKALDTPGSACIDTSHGVCTGCGAVTTACMPPCPK